MVGTGKGKQRPSGALLLIILLGFGLGHLAFPDEAPCGAATVWVRLHNAGVSHYQGGGEPAALALDAQGNVYVTGGSEGGETWDYATVSYGPEGQQRWVRRYNRPESDYNEAKAIAVDSQGSVYVTGVSQRWNDIDSYFVTIKYMQSPRTGR